MISLRAAAWLTASPVIAFILYAMWENGFAAGLAIIGVIAFYLVSPILSDFTTRRFAFRRV